MSTWYPRSSHSRRRTPSSLSGVAPTIPTLWNPAMRACSLIATESTDVGSPRIAGKTARSMASHRNGVTGGDEQLSSADFSKRLCPLADHHIAVELLFLLTPDSAGAAKRSCFSIFVDGD